MVRLGKAAVCLALCLVFAMGILPTMAFADGGKLGSGEASLQTQLESLLTIDADEAAALEAGHKAEPDFESGVEVSDLVLYGLDGTTRSLAEDYAGKNYVVIGGRSTCLNTRVTVNNILSLLEEDAYSDVHLVVLDVDGDAEAFAANGFLERHGGKAYFAATDDIRYNIWLWSLLRQVDPEAYASGSVALPFAFAVGEGGTVLWGGTGPFDERETLNEAFGIDASEPDPEPEPGVSSDTVDLAVTASVDQEEARKLLDMVNTAREEAGVAPLKWDEELEEAALQRAAELVVSYSHTRPDGSGFGSVLPPCNAAAENIALGYIDAADVNLGWTNSAGHYRNMTGSRYDSMAAACVAVGGRLHWVELFSDRPGTDAPGEPLVSASESFTVTALAAKLSLSLDEPGKLTVGDAVDLVSLVSASGMPLASGRGLQWEVDDPSVLEVSSDGRAVALEPGSTQVTVSFAADPSISANASVTVEGETVLVGIPVAYSGLVFSASLQRGVPTGEGYVLSGEYEAVEAGEYEAVATLLEGYAWADGSTAPKTVEWAISPASLTEDCMVFTVPDQMYTGSPIEPKIKVYLGDVLLTEGVHYEIAYYEDNVEPGTGWIRIVGIGSIEGSGWTEFAILEPVWMSFPDVVKEVNKAGDPSKVWYVAGGWLEYVVEAGLMSGYSSNGYFGPYDNITRGQVAVILYRAECVKDPSLIERYGSTTDPTKYAQMVAFKDEDANVYYTAAINWAKAVGIMTGDSGTGYTTVRPNDSVARQELCLMLARYANGGVVPETALDPAKAEGILGMEKIASWAKDGVYWAVNNGVIGGVNNGDGTFSMDPAGKTWRSAAAKMFTVTMRDVL